MRASLEISFKITMYTKISQKLKIQSLVTDAE